MSEDGELVRRAAAGDSTAFAELVRAHHAKVLGLCLSLLGEPAAAEDAAQEVFLKAYWSLGRFRGGSSFSTWLYRIASNHCLDALRVRARRRTDSLEALLEAEGDRIQRLLGAGPDEVRREEDRDLVDKILGRLPPEYRLVLTLREMQGLSYDEIARVMECSLDSVKARLRRARESFLETLRHLEAPRDV